MAEYIKSFDSQRHGTPPVVALEHVQEKELDFFDVSCCETNGLARDVSCTSDGTNHDSEVDTSLHERSNIVVNTTC
jgi:hypothetical protein